MAQILDLAYVDVQHDAPAVFDDVEQGTVLKEDVWISAYRRGESSVHGKITVTADEGKLEMSCRGGVMVERASKTNFEVSVPSLSLAVPVRFPRQIINPPYTKPSPVSPELTINAIDYSAKSGKLAIGGPDGYAVVMKPGEREAVELKGHVGDVLAVKWFPSGEVVLTASSDLSVRVFSAVDGVNPRTLRGHTRAITALHILGVGREVLSASKDGTVRQWNVGEGKEVRKWSLTEAGRFVDSMAVVEDASGVAALGGEGGVILAASPEGDVTAFSLSSPDALFTAPSPVDPKLVSMAYSPSLGVLATGHVNGVIALRLLGSLREGGDGSAMLVRRNEAAVYSLAFADTELLVGTSAALPCHLSLASQDGKLSVSVKEEFAGWEAVGIETWALGPDSVFCAGGDASIRRY